MSVCVCVKFFACKYSAYAFPSPTEQTYRFEFLACVYDEDANPVAKISAIKKKFAVASELTPFTYATKWHSLQTVLICNDDDDDDDDDDGDGDGRNDDDGLQLKRGKEYAFVVSVDLPAGEPAPDAIKLQYIYELFLAALAGDDHVKEGLKVLKARQYDMAADTDVGVMAADMLAQGLDIHTLVQGEMVDLGAVNES